MVALGAGMALSLWLAAITGFNPVSVAMVLLLGLLLAGFSSLSIRVDGEALELWFGPGLARRRIPLGAIRGARAVYNPWYYGWRIHWFPSAGWIYNVSGTAGVQLRLEDGRQLRIGTNAPEELVEALEARGVPRLPE